MPVLEITLVEQMTVQFDSRAARKRVLLMLPTTSDSVLAHRAGGELRHLALARGLRKIVATDIMFVRTIRRETGCKRQCAQCASRTISAEEGIVPVPHNWDWCEKAAREISHFLEGRAYSAIMISTLCMGHYLPTIRASTSAPVIFDNHNAEADLMDEMVTHPRWRSENAPALSGSNGTASYPEFGHQQGISTVELRAIAEADLVTVPTPQDIRRLTRRYGRDTPIRVVPNSVDVSPGSRPAQVRRARTCFFVGMLEYFPNTQAALEISRSIGPAIIAAEPDIDVIVAGRRPPQVIRDAAAGNGVTVVGDPEDAAPFFRDSILLVPLDVGSGSRLKILEAFAAGCAVISTAKGAEGITADPWTHYLQAEDTESFVAAVQRIQHDPAEDLERRKAAWDLANACYSWEAVSRHLRAVLAELETAGPVA